MGEVMKILSEKLPRDVVRFVIQPYMMASEKCVTENHERNIFQFKKFINYGWSEDVTSRDQLKWALKQMKLGVYTAYGIRFHEESDE